MTNTFSFNLGFDKPWKRTKRCDGQHKYFAKLAEYKAERQTTAYEEEKAIPDVNPSSYLSRETANSVNLVFSFPTNDKRVTTKSIRWTMDFVFALE